MKKFDPTRLQTFGAGAKVIPRLNPATVTLSKPAALWWQRGKVQMLVGYGTDFIVNLPDLDCTLSADVPGTIGTPAKLPVVASGEVFTNFDKRPMMSPAEQAVTRALRRLNAKMREFDKARKQADGVLPPDETPASEPEPTPASAPEPTAAETSE